MSLVASGRWDCGLPLTVAGAGGGSAVSLALRSGQATPRSGIGSSGALGSSSAASGGCGGTAWASTGTGANAVAAAAHSRCAAPSLEPRPLIQGEALTSAPEPRQYVPSLVEQLRSLSCPSGRSL